MNTQKSCQAYDSIQHGSSTVSRADVNICVYGWLPWQEKHFPAQFFVAEDRSRLISFRRPYFSWCTPLCALLGCFSGANNYGMHIWPIGQMFGTRRGLPCGIARSGLNDFVDSLQSALDTGHVHVFCIMHSQASYSLVDLPTFFVHDLLSDSPYNGLY
jgi:hypothetical protein